MASTRDEADIDNSTTSGDPLIDALLTEYHWSLLARENFQFTIPDDDSDYRSTRDGLINDYPDNNYLDVSEMPLFAVSGIRQVISEYNDILPFAITEQGQNNVDTQIRYGLTDFTESHSADPAYAKLPHDDGLGDDQDNWMSGDIFLNKKNFSNKDAGSMVGSFQYHAFLHETGHALGLKHGHVADEETGFPALPVQFDSMEFSVMTYRSFVGEVIDGPFKNRDGHFAQSLMMLDIQALQFLYGADFTTRSGTTTYRWTTDGQFFIDSAEQWNTSSNVIFHTIWDGGGRDTYDFSDFDTDQSIDLEPGKWSNIGRQRAQLDLDNPQQRARGNVFNALMFNDNSKSLIENAIGGTGNDSIDGNFGENRLSGGDGNDDIIGKVGNDTLFGGRGTDELFGSEGDDRLDGGLGADLLNGGTGFNIAVYDAPGGATVIIEPVGNSGLRWDVSGPAEATGDTLANIGAFLFGNGSDNITLNNGPSKTTLWIQSAGGNDTITGSNGLSDKDFMVGGNGTDRFVVRRGAFEVYGGERAPGGGWIERVKDDDLLVIDRSDSATGYTIFRLNDASSPLGAFHALAEGSFARGIARLHFIGSAFRDDIGGGIGNDTLTGGAGEDNLNAGAGNDLIIGGAGRDGIGGQEGDDTIIAGPDDIVFGGPGNDSILAGGTSALGGTENDTIIGGDADERYEGNEGNDSIVSGAGSDQIPGGPGSDTLEGGAGEDFIGGGDGIDLLSYTSSNAGVTVNLIEMSADGGHATEDRIDSVENVRGSQFKDVLTGDGGRNLLFGRDGADRLAGASGNDRLEGGDGADTFRYPTKAIGKDTIVDFQNEIDKISLVGSGLTFASFAETLSAGGKHTILTLKSTPANTITLLNILPGEISAGDFLV